MTKKMTRWSLCAITAVLAIGLPMQADAAPTRTYRYIVPPFQSPDAISLPAPGPTIVPFGEVEIVPEGTSVTVTIADDVHPKGKFLFSICQPNQAQEGDAFCGTGADDVTTGNICYRGATTLRRVIPGNPVLVTLWWAPSPCPDAPVTGTLTVIG